MCKMWTAWCARPRDEAVMKLQICLNSSLNMHSVSMHISSTQKAWLQVLTDTVKLFTCFSESLLTLHIYLAWTRNMGVVAHPETRHRSLLSLMTGDLRGARPHRAALLSAPRPQAPPLGWLWGCAPSWFSGPSWGFPPQDQPLHL